MIQMFFKVYYFQSFKNFKYFVKKIKDLACSFFNAHALIDKGFIVLPLSVGLSKFLTKINSKLLSLEDLFLILSVWVPFVDTHLLITRSRSPDKVKVSYQGQIPENWLYLGFLKTRRKINILLQTYKRYMYNGHMQGTVFTKVFTNL